MSTEKQGYPARLAAFLSDLRDLTNRHGIYIGGCGCCGSPYLEDTDGTDPCAGYIIDPGDDKLLWVSKADDARKFGMYGHLVSHPCAPSDTARVDYLEKHDVATEFHEVYDTAYCVSLNDGSWEKRATLREAVDAAIAANAKDEAPSDDQN